MFGKEATDRWNDTIAYLDARFPCNGLTHALGAHIETVVPQIQRNAISDELHIGTRSDKTSDPTYVATTQKRRALRALLLCQRTYFSALWAKKTFNAVPNNPVTDLLAPNWKTLS